MIGAALQIWNYLTKETTGRNNIHIVSMIMFLWTLQVENASELPGKWNREADR